jgi:hypothetical protein
MALDNDDRVLLDNRFFTIRATQTTAVNISGDNTIRQRIVATQEYDKEVTQALESILKNGPRSITKGLEDWNLEDGLILYRGQVYVPQNETLRRDIVKQYHDHVATGHPGRWKTYELVSREFWWPGISTFVKSYVDDAPHVKLPKYGQETVYPCNQIKYPQKYGRRLPWTSSWTSQYLKDTIHYSLWWIISAKPPSSPLVTRQSQLKKPPTFIWKMFGDKQDYHVK